MLKDCNGKEFATLEDMQKERERIERLDQRKLAAAKVVAYLGNCSSLSGKILVARAKNVLATE